MSTPEPAESIAQSLARLRGRTTHHGGHRHARGNHSHHHHAPPWAGGSGLRGGGPARMRMLEALVAASEPLSVSEIAETVGVDQPRASRLVQQGVELGLVVREADPADGRRIRIALTEQGRHLAHSVRGARRDLVERALASFTEAERAELARLLGKLAENWGS